MSLDNFLIGSQKKEKGSIRTVCYYSSLTGKVTWYFKSDRKNLEINFSKTIKWRQLKIDIEMASDLVLEPKEFLTSSSKQMISILKSNLQKAVRRQNLKSALESAYQIYQLDPLILARRLAIISVEDVILLEDFSYLLFVIAVYPQMIPDLDLMLRMVEALVKSPKRDYLPSNRSKDKVKIEDLEKVESLNLDELERSLVYSLYLRSSYGGLKGDIEMLVGYGRLWMERFSSSQKDQWRDFLVQIPNQITFDQKFSKDSLIIEAVDFHTCPQMLKELLKYIKGLSEEKLKKIIWYCRSGINSRGETESYLKKQKEYQKIYLKIEKLIDKYSILKIKETFYIDSF